MSRILFFTEQLKQKYLGDTYDKKKRATGLNIKEFESIKKETRFIREKTKNASQVLEEVSWKNINGCRKMKFQPENRIADFYKDGLKLPDVKQEEFFSDEIATAKEVLKRAKDALDRKRPVSDEDLIGVIHLASEYIHLLRGEEWQKKKELKEEANKKTSKPWERHRKKKQKPTNFRIINYLTF